MQQAFMRGCNPPRPMILRLRMQPLTLTHAMLLHKHAPALIAGGEPDFETLMRGVLVCSAAPEKADESGTSYPSTAAGWLWGWKCRKLNLKDECELFAKYLRESFFPPNILTEAREVAQLNAPYVFRLVIGFTVDVGMTYREAMTVPVVTGLCLWATALELAGKVRISSDQMEELVQYAKTQDAPRPGGAAL